MPQPVTASRTCAAGCCLKQHGAACLVPVAEWHSCVAAATIAYVIGFGTSLGRSNHADRQVSCSRSGLGSAVDAEAPHLPAEMLSAHSFETLQ